MKRIMRSVFHSWKALWSMSFKAKMCYLILMGLQLPFVLALMSIWRGIGLVYLLFAMVVYPVLIFVIGESERKRSIETREPAVVIDMDEARKRLRGETYYEQS